MKYFAAQLIYKIAGTLYQPQPYLIEMRMVSAGEQQAALREARRMGEASVNSNPGGTNRIFLGIKSLEEVPMSNSHLIFGETQEILVADPLA